MNILEKIIIDKKKEVKNDKLKFPINDLKKKISQKNNFFSQRLKEYEKKIHQL